MKIKLHNPQAAQRVELPCGYRITRSGGRITLWCRNQVIRRYSDSDYESAEADAYRLIMP